MDIQNAKINLVNLVSASMVAEPKFGPEDLTSTHIRNLVREVAQKDPEFVLKMALYVRDDLNIRSTANFLLALAADTPNCTPYLKKYFKACIRLPSDWLDVAALYQMLPERHLQGRALPTSLREAMIHKFPDFDAYQLGKYNKEGRTKRKAKKEKLEKQKREEAGEEPPEEDKTPKKSMLTMKQMIRQLHIRDPVEYVMCILGKKYPLNEEAFRASKLPGNFDSARAGKRMRLPIPETWETLVSAKGNKAATWEELIDHKKLPFMAMLRNLRNLILAGISHRHHSWVLSKLNNEGAVAASRQFPFSFFSAYEAIDIDLAKLKEEVTKAKEELKQQQAAGGGKKGKKKKVEKEVSVDAEGNQVVRRKKKVVIPAQMPDENLLKKYREALDNAVKFATVHNVKPIRGSTVVLCNVAADMRTKCNTARGMGGVRQVHEVGILLGLMCKYMCEECDFQIFSSPGPSHPHPNLRVELKEGTILHNMKAVLEAIEQLGYECQFPFAYLEDLIRARRKVDQIIVLSNTHIAPGYDEKEGVDPLSTGGISRILKKYRQEVNPDLLYVAVNLSSPKGITTPNDDSEQHQNDVTISGFSDAILKYVAERGDGNQLDYIMHIDETKGISHIKVNHPRLGGPKKDKKEIDEEKKNVWAFMNAIQLCKHDGCDRRIHKDKLAHHMADCEFRPVPCPYADTGCEQQVPLNALDAHASRCLFKPLSVPKAGGWKTARVFVSSTFLDMHGERDVLIHKVMPELRQRCRKRKVHLYEVDLRWGVTHNEAETNKTLEICLSEIDRCRPFFIGLLGERYGYCPAEYVLPDEPAYEWLKKMPKGLSVTELEMWHGALRNPGASHAHFYLRDPAMVDQVPDDFKKSFAAENPSARGNIARLKGLLREKCSANTHQYSAHWGGVVDGKPMAAGLEQFGKRVLEDLWQSICAVYPEDDAADDALVELREFHHTFQETVSKRFVGRHDARSRLFKFADGADPNPVFGVYGPSGEGKSALLAHFASEYGKLRPGVHVITHFVGCAPNSADIRHTLHRLCEELKKRFDLTDEIPDEHKELRQTFARFLDLASLTGRVLIVIDGLNQFTDANRPQSLDWLPAKSAARIIVSTESDSTSHRALQYRKSELLELAPLNEKERRDLVRQTLWDYRKRLDEQASNNQMRALLKKTEGGKPLYLVVACEELRVFGVFEKVWDKIKALPPTVPRLFDEILARLEAESGKEVVKQMLSLLLVARDGLLESELLALLGNKNEPLPQAKWAVLYRGLHAYLRPTTESGEGTLGFFHSLFAKSAAKRYLVRDQEFICHKALANYFLSLADPTGDLTFQGSDERAASELAYHLTKARMWRELEAALTSLVFIERKCSQDQVYDLVEDLDLACSSPDVSDSVRAHLRDFHRFIAGNVHILTGLPRLVFQQAANQPDISLAATNAKARFDAHEENRPWLRWLNKPQKHDACLLTLAGYSEPVLAAAFSPDGARMVTASRDRKLRIWDAKSGVELAVMSGHTHWIVACHYSPDGTMIASGSWDSTVKIWDAETGALLQTLDGHNKRVNACAWASDSKRLLSASWDCSLILWDATKAEVLRKFRGHTKPINTCAFSVDNAMIASASWDSTIRIWSAEDGSVLKTLKGHSGSVRSIEFAPNGRQLVSTSVDCSLKVWDLRTGQETATIAGHTKPVNSVSFSQDGKVLVTASDDQTVKVWDALGGREVNSLRHADEEVLVTACNFSPDAKRVVAGQSNCNIAVYDAVYSTELATMKGHTRTINAVVFSPDGKYVLSASDDRLLKLWDANSGKEVRTFTGHEGAVNDCAFNEDGTQFVSASDDFSLRRWDVKTGAELMVMRGHTGPVKACAYSPKGKLIASSSKDSAVKLWDIETGRCRVTLSGHMDWVNRLAFSSDGRKLVTASWDFNLKVWDVRKGTELLTLSGHLGAAVACAFSDDGKRIVSGSFDSTLKIWDADEGLLITTLTGHTSRVNAVAFSFDGRSVVSSADDHTLKLWDAVAGSEITTLQGHSGIIRNVRFNPSTMQVVSASEDCTVKVWDALAPKEIVGHSDAITAVAYSPDGQRLITASRDRTIGLWDVTKRRRVACFDSHTEAVNACTFSPDGKFFASASDDRTLRICEASGRYVRTLSNHTNAVKSCSFAPDSRTLASGAWDSSVKIWNVTNGSVLKSLTGHTDWVNCVSYSPVAAKPLVASASHDHTVKLWDPQSGDCRATLRPHQNWALCCAFSSDAGLIVSSGYSSEVAVWDVQRQSAVVTFQGHKKRANSCMFLANDKLVASIANDGVLQLWDARSAAKVAWFFTRGQGTAVGVSRGSQLAAGDSLGNLFFLDFMKA